MQFRTKIKYSKFNKLDKADIFNVIERYLNEERFNYSVRKKNKIIFHKSDGWTSFNAKSFLVSGIVKVTEKDDGFEIINGNWMVFLIAIPFLLIIFLADSDFSTIDENDIRIIKYFFTVIFGGNLIIRFFAHLTFKTKIKELIKTMHNTV
ncbi:hypothetical protein SAMN05216261_1103 [Algibacter luteus]|uniref:Uncharacterized protein n=2 Tax=Algibacter luteus TaxID=1178825 RepID=A0A1M6C7Q0_9FLAO|nr:hypothetical protein SAMN05216261_1103 [Algibacter luteus]